MTAATPSAAVAALLSPQGVPLDDPAETYHEASRLSPSTALAQLPGLQLLRDEPVLQASVARAARPHRHRPGVDLPEPQLPETALRDVLARRRSGFGEARPLELEQLAAVLAAAHGVRADGRRPAPSGGALYPLELYVVAAEVGGLGAGVYHYDPYRPRLAELRDGCDGVAAAFADADLFARTAAMLLITAVFWRSRFKYGQRGYRFALLEAGHVAQNALLAATALDLPALPLGGFYDRELERVVGVDGVDEAAVYALLLGGRE